MMTKDPETTTPPDSFTDHRLRSTERGASEVEQLADRVTQRRANRTLVTFPVRKAFLTDCIRLSEEKGTKNKVHRQDIVAWKADLEGQQKPGKKALARAIDWMGFRDQDTTMLKLYERALERIDEVDREWLYYHDFIFYDTRLESVWPWMRSGPLAVAMVIFGFYIFTPVLFCGIMNDKQVCPDDPTGQGRAYYGWLTSVYFASTTMSTVGYGDVSVSKDAKWKVFIGALYMLLSIVVAMTAFAAAADTAYNVTLGPLNAMTESLLNSVGGHSSDKKMLHEHIRRVKIIKIAEVVVQLALLNLVGIFVSRAFANNATLEDEQWDWMTSFYWSIQTTTTIGYGDLSMPFDLRWFQVFYLAFSTYFVGSTFGKLGGLKAELESLKKHYAWQRREVNKRLVEEMQAYNHDDKVDQFEFVVSSLLTLDKITASDIQPIMDKFRMLAGKKGYIQLASPIEIAEASTDDSEQAELDDAITDMNYAE